MSLWIRQEVQKMLLLTRGFHYFTHHAVLFFAINVISLRLKLKFCFGTAGEILPTEADGHTSSSSIDGAEGILD